MNDTLKAIFISCNQALYPEIIALFDKRHLKGYTAWSEVMGRGSKSGEPHLGSHAWPTLNSAIMIILPAEVAPSLLDDLRAIDRKSEQQGLRAFEWDITRSI